MIKKLKTTMSLTIALFGGLTANEAFAQGQQWHMAASNKGIIQFVELSSRTTNGTLIRAWTASINLDGAVKLGQVPILASKQLKEIDCAQRRTRGIQFLLYGKNHVLVRAIDTPNSQWAYEVPGSIGESVMLTACGLIEPKISIDPGVDPTLSADIMVAANKVK